jgi:hypothetical protein
MHKTIELVLVTDPQSLKVKLEEMVNLGWEIRGFVKLESGTNYLETFAVMEGLTESESVKPPEFSQVETEPGQATYTQKPKKKEISISIGGN